MMIGQLLVVAIATLAVANARGLNAVNCDARSLNGPYYSTADPRLSAGTVKNILGLFGKWNAALASGNATKVAEMYASDGVLLPTKSNCVRATGKGIEDYFVDFLKLEPQGVIDEYGIRLEAVDSEGMPTIISNSGIYTFSLGINDSKVQARFTYVYKKVDGKWKILSHHSSEVPSTFKAEPLSEYECLTGESTVDQSLSEPEKQGILSAFTMWNNALKTEDPDQVIALYTHDAILLPTLSDNVRTTKGERRGYFVDFLAKQPIGTIDEYHIRVLGRDDIGLPNAVINQGIYTFDFSDGSKAQARFSYHYERDGDRWMIKKHHSSQMPETPETEEKA